MEKVSLQSVQIEQARIDAAVELAGIDPKDYEGMELFRGVALSQSINTHSLHFSDEALRQVKGAFNDQLGVFTDHNITASNRIGKTLKADIRDSKVRTYFGVIPGLEQANTDDLIKIMRLAGSEMSISFYPAMDGMQCDICQLAMQPYYYGYIYMCDNYHMLGEVYEEGAGRKTVTAQVTDVDRVSELSVVGNGSDYNTEILQEMADAGISFSLPLTQTIAETNNIDFRALSQELSSNGFNWNKELDTNKIITIGRNPQMLNPNPNPTPEPTPTPPAPNPADPVDFSNKSNEDLVQTIQQLVAEKAELQEQLDTAITQEVYTQALEATTNLQAQLDAEKAKVVEFDAMKATVDSELTYWRETALKNKKQQMSYSDTDPRLIQYKQWADSCNDIARLRIDATTSFAAYAATCLETPTLTIDVDESNTRVGSGYTN